MSFSKQVDKSHYRFSHYMSRARWGSVWHQLDETFRLEPESVLEIGPGPGVFKAAAAQFGLKVETADIDPELKPDHLVDATALPFADDAYDVVCAFQMLEHVPYEMSLKILREMSRVARKGVVISLPDAWPARLVQIQVPKMGLISWLIPSLLFRPPERRFNGEHYWEINWQGYSLRKISDDLSTIRVVKSTFRVTDNPSHRFFVLV